MSGLRVVLVDAFDSFVHTIGQYFSVLGAETTVLRIGDRTAERIMSHRPTLVVLGPGPGHPADNEYVSLLTGGLPEDLPVLGVCLGHQAVGLAFGAEVVRAPVVRHGKPSPVQHDGTGCFDGASQRLNVIRYHSLVVAEPPTGSDLRVTARSTDDHQVMGLSHRDRPIESVQFHPESIASDSGLDLLRSALAGAQIHRHRTRKAG